MAALLVDVRGRLSMNTWEQKERAQLTLAKEVGYTRKPHGDRLRIALAFPNTYWVGMSNLGFQTVYSLFNAEDDMATLSPTHRRENHHATTHLYHREYGTRRCESKETTVENPGCPDG